MLLYYVPGIGKIEIENVVFDYNGTLAVDGKLIEEVKELLRELKKYVNIQVLTADTYGTAKAECSELELSVSTFPREMASVAKRDIVESLGAEKTICVGNGVNDIEMFKVSKLSIAVIEKEGCSGKLMAHCDIVVASIKDALQLILSKDRVKATLRT